MTKVSRENEEMKRAIDRALRDHLRGVTEKLETCMTRRVRTSNGIPCKWYVELLSSAAMHYVHINFAGKRTIVHRSNHLLGFFVFPITLSSYILTCYYTSAEQS